jgi:hypothetical protein
MPEKKKTKKATKVRRRDLKPRKDAKGGLVRFSRSPSTKQPTGLALQ